MKFLMTILTVSAFVGLISPASVGAQSQTPTGNMDAQEVGDAIYRWGGFSRKYNHAGLYEGYYLASHHLIEVNKEIWTDFFPLGHVVYRYDFDVDRSADTWTDWSGDAQEYYGAHSTGGTMTRDEREAIINTAIQCKNHGSIDYTLYDMFDWGGFSWDGSIEDIAELRCDGLVEVCYEANSFRIKEVWGKQVGSSFNYSIAQYPDEHNIAPGFLGYDDPDPTFETAPSVQRGEWGLSYTKLRETNVDLPVVNVTYPSSPNPANPTITNETTFDVFATASDNQSPIHWDWYFYWSDSTGGGWSDWQEFPNNPTTLWGQFTGQVGHKYRFRCEAFDMAMNKGISGAKYIRIQSAGPEDCFEPNNTVAEARARPAIPANTWVSATGDCGQPIHNNEDVYMINIPQGWPCVYFLCRFKHSEGDLDMYIWNNNESLVLQSSTSDDDESNCLDMTGNAPGTYFISIHNSGATGNSYDLWWGNECSIQVPLKSPENNSTFTVDYNNEIFLRWYADDRAERYRVAIDDDPNFGSPILESRSHPRDSLELFNEVAELPPDTYYWRIQVDNGCDWGEYGDAWAFTLCETLGALSLVSPADGVLGVDQPVHCDWSDAPGAAQYQLEIETIGSFLTTQSYFDIPPTLVDDSEYSWRVRARDGCGWWGPWSQFWSFLAGPSDDVVEIPSPVLPEHFILSQNYPNPFNPETRIEFALPRASFVSIDVINVLGHGVRTLVNERLSAGYKVVTWDGRNDRGSEVSSGIYYYRIMAGDFVESKKMVFMK